MRLAVRSTVLVSTVALLATGFGPADDAECRAIEDPRDPEAVVEFCEATGYFSSDNPLKADNLASAGLTDLPTWVADEPGSVTGGSGAGFLAQWQTSIVTGPDDISGVTYVGTFTGALDAIAIDQYAFTAAEDVNAVYAFVLSLAIDGESVYESEFVEGDTAPISSGGAAVKVFRFAVKDIFADAGVYDGEHELEINITPYFPGDEAIYVYGAAEAPSAITFNPSDLAGYRQISAKNG